MMINEEIRDSFFRVDEMLSFNLIIKLKSLIAQVSSALIRLLRISDT
jgi:hypothetical protein